MPGRRSPRPDGPPPPPVAARVRIRYAKRGRLRFASHRDFARAFERALRRAAVPMAYSAGFTPHPKISYVGAAPTGAASDAEYLEIGLTGAVDPGRLDAELNAALPDGFDIVEVVPVSSPDRFADRMVASRWRIALPGRAVDAVDAAVARFRAADQALVTRVTKSGRRDVDARAAVVSVTVSGSGGPAPHAILDVVVRQVTPAVRPEDVLTALREAGGLASTGTADPAVATRLAQGPLLEDGTVGDPLAPDRTP